MKKEILFLDIKCILNKEFHSKHCTSILIWLNDDLPPKSLVEFASTNHKQFAKNVQFYESGWAKVIKWVVINQAFTLNNAAKSCDFIEWKIVWLFDVTETRKMMQIELSELASTRLMALYNSRARALKRRCG